MSFFLPRQQGMMYILQQLESGGAASEKLMGANVAMKGLNLLLTGENIFHWGRNMLG
jgi:hypothetical protein